MKTLSDTEIKVLIATKVLRNIPDKSIEFLIRKILFSEKNIIDWQDAYIKTLLQMPELRNSEG